VSHESLMTDYVVVELPDGTPLRCSALSQAGEVALGRELGRRLHKSYGPGGHFAAIKPALDWMKENGMTVAYQIAVSDVTRLEATRALPEWDAIEQYRQTPDGLAAELFLRTRESHPDLAEGIIRADLNELVAWQIHTALVDALAANSKSRTASASTVAGG
jgi:hypothetical protein